MAGGEAIKLHVAREGAFETLKCYERRDDHRRRVLFSTFFMDGTDGYRGLGGGLCNRGHWCPASIRYRPLAAGLTLLHSLPRSTRREGDGVGRTRPRDGGDCGVCMYWYRPPRSRHCHPRPSI